MDDDDYEQYETGDYTQDFDEEERDPMTDAEWNEIQEETQNEIKTNDLVWSAICEYDSNHIRPEYGNDKTDFKSCQNYVNLVLYY